MEDPLVSFTVYDVVKSIYSSNNNLEDVRSRISAIQNTLSQLRVTNIATLDALTQHFARLIEMTSADEEWVNELAQNVSYCTSPQVDPTDKRFITTSSGKFGDTTRSPFHSSVGRLDQ
jgi:hypothetical protein